VAEDRSVKGIDAALTVEIAPIAIAKHVDKRVMISISSFLVFVYGQRRRLRLHRDNAFAARNVPVPT